MPLAVQITLLLTLAPISELPLCANLILRQRPELSAFTTYKPTDTANYRNSHAVLKNYTIYSNCPLYNLSIRCKILGVNRKMGFSSIKPTLDQQLWIRTLIHICPGSSDPFYLVRYYIKCVTRSWTDGTFEIQHYILDVQEVMIRFMQ